MKKIYIITGAFSLFALALGVMPKTVSARLNGTNFGANYSGLTGTTCNASGCHVGSALNSGGGSVEITNNIPAGGYVGGTTYSVSVTVNAGGTNGNAFGFCCSAAKNGMTASVGGFAAPDNVTLIKSNGAYIVHRTALSGSGSSDSKTFTFNWTAPATGSGTIKFFAAGNSANANNDESGDKIYTTTLLVNEAPGAGITEAVINAFELFPNPATEQVTLNVPAQLLNGSVRVLDMTGKTVFNKQLTQEQLSIDLTTFTQGAYIVEIQKDGQSYTSRLLKR